MSLIRNYLLAAVLFLFLFSCGSAPGGSSPASKPETESTQPITTVVFDCDSGNLAAIRFWKDRCQLTGMIRKQNLDYMLPQVESASGARYSDGKIIVWNKGNDVFIDLGNGQTYNCTKKNEVRPEQ